MNSTLENQKNELTNSSAAEIADLESVNQAQVGGLGTWFLRDMWYFALASSKLKKGKMQAKTMLGEPILIGRDNTGKAFAMKKRKRR